MLHNNFANCIVKCSRYFHDSPSLHLLFLLFPPDHIQAITYPSSLFTGPAYPFPRNMNKYIAKYPMWVRSPGLSYYTL
jgi:hypothetical protein